MPFFIVSAVKTSNLTSEGTFLLQKFWLKAVLSSLEFLFILAQFLHQDGRHLTYKTTREPENRLLSNFAATVDAIRQVALPPA
jgi:hypothetical protein